MVSLKDVCCMLRQKSHSWHKLWLTNTRIPSFILSLPTCLYLFIFAIHKTKEKVTPQNTNGIKGQPFCLSSPHSPFPILYCCLKQSAVLRDSHCFPLFFFFLLLALEKPVNTPRRGENFFLQLIFIRNMINNTWHFNKTLSEWFNEKQIHYVKTQ